MLLGTHAEKTSERHHGVSNPATNLFDHEALDAAEIVPLWIIGLSCLQLGRFQSTACLSLLRYFGHSSESPVANAQSTQWLQRTAADGISAVPR